MVFHLSFPANEGTNTFPGGQIQVGHAIRETSGFSLIHVDITTEPFQGEVLITITAIVSSTRDP